MSFILRLKLSAMMFLQFMLVASFWVQLSTYLNNMKIEGIMFSLVMSTMAIGSIFSPLVGMFADRVANSEKVLFVLNLLVAIFLTGAYFSTNPTLIFVCLLLAMCAYMPTWGLTSSIAITNSTAEAFPTIRVFGSLGWVSAAIFSIVASQYFNKTIDGTAIPLACGAAIAFISAVFALTLPATPPQSKGQKMSLSDALGLGAFSMLKDRNVCVFMACVVLWTVAFTIYWMYGSFLQDLGVKNITPVLNVGQISELLFMVLIPVSIKFIGFKKTMAFGIFAMLVRYLFSAFAQDVPNLYWGAIVVHGIIFGFFFVVAQMYIGKKAPKEIQAQAQGLYFFFYGIAQIVATFFSTFLIENIKKTPEVAKSLGCVVADTAASLAKTDWTSVFYIEAGITAFLLFFILVFFKDDVKD